MNTNEKLIQHFYTCFKHKDISGMQECYAEEADFSDAVFKDLDTKQVRSMWAMLIKSGKDLEIKFSNIYADEHTATADWQAAYTFSVTGRKVLNKIKASFILKDGKIISHKDNFNFYIWAKQALGLPGLLLGWTPFIKNKIRKKAAKNLLSYMKAQ
ncbi:nuclear transport factor 2 family protein [Pedobacter metabolipauper]|nr:nuclear transport factor 2 family protein [Pedobacter metabolipauper]